MPTIQAYASSFNNAIPTGFTGGQFTNPTNAVGSTEATYATAAPAGTGTDFGNHYFFTGFSGIPNGATINSITLEARHFATFTNRGTFGYRIDSAPNTQIANEVTATVVGTAAPGAGLAGTNGTFTSFSALPTVAQLQSANFGVRARFQRTGSTVTASLDWLRITVDYSPAPTLHSDSATLTLVETLLKQARVSDVAVVSTVPKVSKQGLKSIVAGSTLSPTVSMQVLKGITAVSPLSPTLGTQFIGGAATDVELRVGLTNPSRTLRMGSGLQEIRTYVRKSGTGGDPLARVEILEAGSNTVLATPITNTAVSSTTGVELVGYFDASVLTDATGNTAEARIVGTGVTGSCLEIRANPPIVMYWGEETGALVLNRSYQAVLSLTASASRSISHKDAATIPLVASAAKAVRASLAAAVNLAPLAQKRPGILESASATLVAAVQATKVSLKPLIATLTTTPLLSRAILTARGALLAANASVLKRAATALGTSLSLLPSVLKRINKSLTSTVTNVASAAASKVLLKALSAIVTLTATASTLKAFGRALVAPVTLTATTLKRVSKPLGVSVAVVASTLKRALLTKLASSTLAASVSKSARKAFTSVVNLVPSHTATRIRTLAATLYVAATLNYLSIKNLIADLPVVGDLITQKISDAPTTPTPRERQIIVGAFSRTSTPDATSRQITTTKSNRVITIPSRRGF